MNSNSIRTFSFSGLIVFLFLIPLIMKSTYWLHILCIVGINVILVASVHTLWATGEISLGTAGIMCVGAYSSSLLAMKAGFPVWLSIPTGGIVCACIALLLGYPFMRAKGIYFSLVTLLAGEVFRLTAWYYRSLTGGSVGLPNIPTPESINIPWLGIIVFQDKVPFYYLILIITLISAFILYRVQNSQVGFTWDTIREMDDLASSVGINVIGHKIFAFVLGSFFIGLAGAVFAHFMSLLSADASGKFGMFTSIYTLIFMVIGGEKKFSGAIIGTIILTILPELIRSLQEYRPIIFGALVILIVFFFPKGIIDLPNRFIVFFKRIKSQSTSA